MKTVQLKTIINILLVLYSLNYNKINKIIDLMRLTRHLMKHLAIRITIIYNFCQDYNLKMINDNFSKNTSILRKI